jgi:hypothetical protein
MSSDEAIKAEAKQIMDDFMNAMESVSIEETFTLHRESCFREEGEGSEPDEAFRERFLNNAPKRRGDSIYVKKGEWLN